MDRNRVSQPDEVSARMRDGTQLYGHCSKFIKRPNAKARSLSGLFT
ncbi:hypothetical protein PSPO_a0153 [Pseudoalteromonas spongiae UST010723-006]|nr:hypothetical protein PSPO_a0153 [Pseudoalteromonas spongiae UST010723-006]